MPSSMPRCQVLMEPDTYAQMKLLAAYDRRTLSAMCATLIQTALELPRYQSLLAEARVALGEEVVKPDPRKARKQEHRPAVVAAKVAEIVMGDLPGKPLVDAKGYMRKDEYGNVLVESRESIDERAKETPTPTPSTDPKITELRELLGALEALKA